MQDSLQTLSMPIHIDYIVLYAHITYSLKIYLLAQISSNLPKILIFIHMLLHVQIKIDISLGEV